MSIILAEDNCTGCTACVHICPEKCISMKYNSEGFIYPVIDETSCIKCGLCIGACRVLTHKEYNVDCIKAYAAYSTETDIRINSSSGGIFSLLAREILRLGGVVFGAAFDDTMNVHHVQIYSEDDLSLLRGSKYVQSNLEDAFIRVKEILNLGQIVLFSGVICQIAGLKAYLGRDYENLICVDVLCHGVPSPKLWNNYVRELEKTYGSKVDQMFFRYKKYGWKNCAVFFRFSNNSIYERVFHKDPYMKLFLRNICLRPSCYDCQFNCLDRCSDITLGDCWGIGNKMPEMDDDKGTSVILVHTNKGMDILNNVSENIVKKEADLDYILPPESAGRMSVKPHKNRERFFEMLNDDFTISELEKLVELSTSEKIIQLVKSILRKPYYYLKKIIDINYRSYNS